MRSGSDLGCRGARGDRVAEQVSGDVLAVVLTIAPFVWAVRSFCCAATPSPDSPGPHGPLDCSLGRRDPSLLVPSRSSARDPRAVGVKARGALEVETREEPDHPPRLRPEPRRLQRDRPGRGVARPDVVPAIALPGDHRAASGVGERDQHADASGGRDVAPRRGAAGPRGLVSRPTSGGENGPGPRRRRSGEPASRSRSGAAAARSRPKQRRRRGPLRRPRRCSASHPGR